MATVYQTYKHISRRDFGNLRGWVVRSAYITKYFKEFFGEEEKNWFFDDKKLGGKQVSLAAAKNFRDKYLKQANAPERVPGDKGRIYVGQKSYRPRNGGDLVHYDVWFAWVRVDGKPASTSYSIAKYGYEEAKKMAARWLRKKRTGS